MDDSAWAFLLGLIGYPDQIVSHLAIFFGLVLIAKNIVSPKQNDADGHSQSTDISQKGKGNKATVKTINGTIVVKNVVYAGSSEQSSDSPERSSGSSDPSEHSSEPVSQNQNSASQSGENNSSTNLSKWIRKNINRSVIIGAVLIGVGVIMLGGSQNESVSEFDVHGFSPESIAVKDDIFYFVDRNNLYSCSISDENRDSHQIFLTDHETDFSYKADVIHFYDDVLYVLTDSQPAGNGLYRYTILYGTETDGFTSVMEKPFESESKTQRIMSDFAISSNKLLYVERTDYGGIGQDVTYTLWCCKQNKQTGKYQQENAEKIHPYDGSLSAYPRLIIEEYDLYITPPDKNHVFFLDNVHNTDLNNKPEPFSDVFAHPAALATDTQYLYVLDLFQKPAEEDQYDGGSVYRIPLNGGKQEKLTELPFEHTDSKSFMAADDKGNLFISAPAGHVTYQVRLH